MSLVVTLIREPSLRNVLGVLYIFPIFLLWREGFDTLQANNPSSTSTQLYEAQGPGISPLTAPPDVDRMPFQGEILTLFATCFSTPIYMSFRNEDSLLDSLDPR